MMRLRRVPFCFGRTLNNRMMTFVEYVRMREGLWLADKNAVPGMSNVNPLAPGRAKPKRTMPTPFKAANVFKSSATRVKHPVLPKG
jgi:hypothetical protein